MGATDVSRLSYTFRRLKGGFFKKPDKDTACQEYQKAGMHSSSMLDLPNVALRIALVRSSPYPRTKCILFQIIRG